MMRSWTAAVLALAAPALLPAQVMLTTTVGTVRYDGEPAATSVQLAPAVHFERRGLALDATSGWSTANDGSRGFDGSGSAWAATPATRHHLQLDGLVQGSVTSPANDSASSALLALGEAAWALADRGLAAGIGVAHGTIQGLPAANALRAEVRGWTELGDVTFTGAIEPTRFAGTWFVEYAGSAERAVGPLDITGSLRVREVSAAPAAVGGSAEVAWDVSRRLTADLQGGRYLRDPYQGLPPGYFLTLGLKVKLAYLAGGTGEGVGAASLGDVAVRAASNSLGFGTHGNSHRGTTQLSGSTSGPGSSSGRGSGNGHRP